MVFAELLAFRGTGAERVPTHFFRLQHLQMGYPIRMASSEEPAKAVSVATNRTPGYDVARALALLGMVVINYWHRLASDADPSRLVNALERIEGRPAALFVVLAGAGVSLRSRRARREPEQHARFERVALLKRAAVLMLVGLLNLHLSDYDILHCYGAYLALAVLLLTSRAVVLWLAALASVGISVVLRIVFDYYSDLEFWSLSGFFSGVFFDGLYPVFPWMAFLVTGMLVGRLDLRSARTLRRLLIAALPLCVIATVLTVLEGEVPEVFLDDLGYPGWLSSVPRPAGPMYVVGGAATAVTMICLCVFATERRASAGWVTVLTATGQMAFTLYFLHELALELPRRHEWLPENSAEFAVAYASGFYVLALMFSVWWRRRWAYGPLEGLIRQITGRVGSAPWGGALLGSARDEE